MTATLSKSPTFRPTQRVKFVGGEGTVHSYKRNAETWDYLVEMPLGLHPDFGRVGAETMVLLNEADLHAA